MQLLQLADILLGAMGYHARGLDKNEGKIILLNRIKQRSGYNLDKSTLPSEGKLKYFLLKGVSIKLSLNFELLMSNLPSLILLSEYGGIGMYILKQSIQYLKRISFILNQNWNI